MENGGPTAAATAAAQPRIQNTQWQLISIGDIVLPTTGDGSARVFFGLGDTFNGIQANGPCDKAIGKYHTEGVDFKTVELAASTTDTCAADATAAQKAFMDAMLGATNLSITGDELTITGSDTLTFKPVAR